MDETYGTYVDDECFDIHDYDDDTDHDTDDDTGDDTDDDTNDDTDGDTDDGGPGSGRSGSGRSREGPYTFTQWIDVAFHSDFATCNDIP